MAKPKPVYEDGRVLRHIEQAEFNGAVDYVSDLGLEIPQGWMTGGFRAQVPRYFKYLSKAQLQTVLGVWPHCWALRGAGAQGSRTVPLFPRCLVEALVARLGVPRNKYDSSHFERSYFPTKWTHPPMVGCEVSVWLGDDHPEIERGTIRVMSLRKSYGTVMVKYGDSSNYLYRQFLTEYVYPMGSGR